VSEKERERERERERGRETEREREIQKEREGNVTKHKPHAIVTGSLWPFGANIGPTIAPMDRPMRAPNAPIVAHDVAVPMAISPQL
jgi:hypothetical protein